MFKTFSIVFLTVLVSLGRGFVALGSPLEIDPEANRLGDFNQGPAKLSQEIQLQIENLTREALRERDLKEEFHSLSPLLGHNLTATTDTPKQGHWLLGDYAIAYGITDQLMVGLNPWITINYNMSAAGIKYALDRGSYFQNLLDRVSFEIYYFKTYQILFDGYHQSSWFTRLSGTQMLASNYRLHGSISFQYFYDSLAPFSLRPPPIGDSPVTLSAGLLHEIHVTEKTGFFIENGILGFNYQNRYLQMGLSGFYQDTWGYIQLGLSKSYPIGQRLTGYPPAYWTDDHGGTHESVYYIFYAPVHPEIQVQFLL